MSNGRKPNNKNNSSTLVKTELPIPNLSVFSSFSNLEQYRAPTSVNKNSPPTVFKPRLVNIF
ncbi:MAG: hypothetical protein Athens071416_531 [Parcubacteria group bacterium Athens0714_16]|nr:MAG: hypothetical protein Athens071416_531 [Parcubacteria group bacterium Athens0714_16]